MHVVHVPTVHRGPDLWDKDCPLQTESLAWAWGRRANIITAVFGVQARPRNGKVTIDQGTDYPGKVTYLRSQTHLSSSWTDIMSWTITNTGRRRRIAPHSYAQALVRKDVTTLRRETVSLSSQFLINAMLTPHIAIVVFYEYSFYKNFRPIKRSVVGILAIKHQEFGILKPATSFV